MAKTSVPSPVFLVITCAGDRFPLSGPLPYGSLIQEQLELCSDLMLCLVRVSSKIEQNF